MSSTFNTIVINLLAILEEGIQLMYLRDVFRLTYLDFRTILLTISITSKFYTVTI